MLECARMACKIRTHAFHPINFMMDAFTIEQFSRQQNLSQLQEFADDLETTTALINEREESIRKLEVNFAPQVFDL